MNMPTNNKIKVKDKSLKQMMMFLKQKFADALKARHFNNVCNGISSQIRLLLLRKVRKLENVITLQP